jgi:hypothetical protein
MTDTKEIKSPVFHKTVKYPTLNEVEFYEVYLTLHNLSKTKETRLSEKAIKLLALYLAKPLEFAIDFNSKRAYNMVVKGVKVKRTWTKFLGEELGIKPVYTYLLMKELRDKGALLIDEDNLLRPNEQLTTLRKGMKEAFSKYEIVRFDYIFQTSTVDNDERNENNLPKGS